MSLKQLRLASQIKAKRNEINALFESEEKYIELRDSFATREKELREALEQAESEEDIELVNESIESLENESKEFNEKEEDKKKLEEELEELEVELEELNEEAPKNNESQRSKKENKETLGGDSRMAHNQYETRSQILERLNQTEVRDFYTKVAEASRNKRALDNTEVLIPEQVINMIQQRLGDYSTLYKEVTVQQLSGTARVIMDGAIPEAIWTEMCDPVEELATAFTQTELDGFKVGGFIPVCNAVLEDSMINLANFIEGRLAMAIAKSLDKAILTGEGAAEKQPEGIIPALDGDADRNVTSTGELGDIVGNMAVIDNGEDGEQIGEVIAVMKRSTYYSKLAPQTFLPTSDGRLVVQTAQSPKLPDGTRIVFSQYAPENTIVLGDFKKYLLGERAGVKLAVSTDVRFIQDQTVFKGTARYDGKPIYTDAFVVIEIDGEEGEDTP